MCGPKTETPSDAIPTRPSRPRAAVRLRHSKGAQPQMIRPRRDSAVSNSHRAVSTTCGTDAAGRVATPRRLRNRLVGVPVLSSAPDCFRMAGLPVPCAPPLHGGKSVDPGSPSRHADAAYADSRRSRVGESAHVRKGLTRGRRRMAAARTSSEPRSPTGHAGERRGTPGLVGRSGHDESITSPTRRRAGRRARAGPTAIPTCPTRETAARRHGRPADQTEPMKTSHEENESSG
ncbi:hypothetical protein FHR81_003563 [Actinoalloteichus hoggarensis]|uniref:Uncharacterized protein n=1 Tax=Actinoalloteichus hoggarensis TaxID=1470176 RepID=A0A221WA78_9PSEU|nr:hypothetical protein AHOG_26500 [Actinoalloteichus hoggarensis]MBB5922506.1 hypothetical protein [Actinoalloteichus hoggarensis]